MGVETMMIAAALATAAGTVGEGVNEFSNSRYKASVLANQAEAARHDAGIAAQLELEDSSRALATAQTIAAKGGGGIEGNALDVLRDLSRQSLYEIQRISIEGDNESRAALADAKQAKRNGNFALGSSVVKAGAQLAGAPNGRGTGTLLSDAIEKRRARGSAPANSRPTAYGRPISW